MSAFICGPDHFKALALFATSRKSFGGWMVDPRYLKGLTHPQSEQRGGIDKLSRVQLANLYADVLYQQNVRSVWARYPNDERNTLPGPCDDPGHVTITGCDEDSMKYARQRVTPVWILKLCDSLAYQSCETDDWEKSLAHELIERIRNAAIARLPGYEDAPWDYYVLSKG